MPLLLILAVAFVSVAIADDLNVHSPSSSSYARVQYANKPNVTRRFGTFRDPTIKYVTFDELYSKQYNKPKGANVQNGPVVLGSTRVSSVSSTHEQKGGFMEKDEDEELPPEELTPVYDDHNDEVDNEDLEAVGTHSSNHSVIHALDKMDSTHPNWDEVPDLTNGWTVERQNEVSSPKMTVVKTTSVTPLASKTKAKGSPAFIKGLDQVYAYSNMYQNYNDQLNKDSQMDRDGWITTKDYTSVTWKSTPVSDPGEYAHAIGDNVDLYVSSNDVTTSPPVVMESSWTDKETLRRPSKPRPKPAVEERIDSKPATEKSVSFSNAVKFPSQADRVGVQSAWRPFSGPTMPPKQAQSGVTKMATAVPKSSTLATNNVDTLFYREAQKAALASKNRITTENPNLLLQNRPTFLVHNHPIRPPLHPGMPPHLLSPQQQQQPFAIRPNEPSNQQVLFIPNAADNINRPPVQGQDFPPQLSVLGNSAPSGLRFPMDAPQPTVQSPFVHPAPFMHNRQPLPGVQQQQQPAQPHTQQPNRFPVQVQPRPDFPVRDMPSDKPLNFGRPPPTGPNRVPSGPVNVLPHLVPNPNQGRPVDESQANTMTIRLPLPRPGPIGTSPDNPLPGPPIPLPGIPSGPIVIANDGPNNNNNGRPNRFQLFNRHDGPGTGQDGPNNILPPPPPQHQGPFPQRNPNMPPNFHPQNFQLPPPPPPPPPQKQSSSSATSLIKSFLSHFLPFGRSMSDEIVPIIDYDKFINSTNITDIAAADPALWKKFLVSAENSTEPLVTHVGSNEVDDDSSNITMTTSGFDQTGVTSEQNVSSTILPLTVTSD